MPQPPDTTAYLYLGLAVVAIILLAFLASMAIRYRNLRRDAEMIIALEERD